jgi:hypothetical protein
VKTDPYVTIHMMGHTWQPVLMDWNPVGYEQVSDTRDATEDRLEAKRAAVAWAKELNVPFKQEIA